MNRMKEVLEAKGITQTWLAKKLGKCYNMVNLYVQKSKATKIGSAFSNCQNIRCACC